MEESKDTHEIQPVAIAILNYFRDHPGAKDSAKGIAQWWVGAQVEVVEKALEMLIIEGVIEKQGMSFQLVQKKPAAKVEQMIDSVMRSLQRNS